MTLILATVDVGSTPTASTILTVRVYLRRLISGALQWSNWCMWVQFPPPVPIYNLSVLYIELKFFAM